MNRLWWKTIGDGNDHIVLLHGWGVNSEVWNCIGEELSSRFTLHLVDLPGFGRSYDFGAMCIEEMTEHVLKNAPNKAIWTGWSMGGLVASMVSMMYPERVQALVTVASSPCFSAQKDWPGIRVEMLSNFQKQLIENFQRTFERFLFLQTLGTKTARQDMNKLKQSTSILYPPSIEVLNGGIEILKKVDLRSPLTNLVVPHLRIYGYLDGLVSHRIVTLLDKYWPKSKSLIFRDASHTPFISHPREFCCIITALSQCL